MSMHLLIISLLSAEMFKYYILTVKIEKNCYYKEDIFIIIEHLHSSYYCYYVTNKLSKENERMWRETKFD